MGVGGQRHAPASLPAGETRYPLHRMLGGLQGRSGWGQKTSSPPGLDPRTVQPVTRCHTDRAIPPHHTPSVINLYEITTQYSEWPRPTTPGFDCRHEQTLLSTTSIRLCDPPTVLRSGYRVGLTDTYWSAYN
jgi:hypothetical protein